MTWPLCDIPTWLDWTRQKLCANSRLLGRHRQDHLHCLLKSSTYRFYTISTLRSYHSSSLSMTQRVFMQAGRRNSQLWWQSVQNLKRVTQLRNMSLIVRRACWIPLQSISNLASSNSTIHSLKLAFYTSLGFTPVSDKDGNVNKMLIRECSARRTSSLRCHWSISRIKIWRSSHCCIREKSYESRLLETALGPCFIITYLCTCSYIIVIVSILVFVPVAYDWWQAIDRKKMQIIRQ